MTFSRRALLTGAGSLALGLPLVPSLRSRSARAGGATTTPPFVIFMDQANGVASEWQHGSLGPEPERFWPHGFGALDAANAEGRTLAELAPFFDRLLVVGSVNMDYFDYQDGHARGYLQGLTARGPTGEYQEHANGESLDHRIGAELNADGRESLFLYVGQEDANICYRGAGQRRSALQDPVQAYETIMGLDTGDFEKLILRQRSVNDLVREQMEAILAHPRLSAADQQRLELHRDSIRDLENTLSCTLEADAEAALAGQAAGHSSDDGDLVLEALRAHMSVAALAVACGYTRSVSIQVGGGGTTRYRNLDNGELMENYHYVSHRRLSHDNSGELIPNSDLLHSHCDIHHARAFLYLLERLDEIVMPDGQPLLDAGLAVWWNENAHGEHFSENIPYVIGGSAGGFLRQGAYVQADDPQASNHRRMLQTIGTAVGLRNADGDPLDDFGDPSLPNGLLPAIMA
jgi:hypothetical protein